MQRVVQIVPSLPPSVCGVGDHALRLGRLLSSCCEVAYCTLQPESPELEAEFCVIPERTEAGLNVALQTLCKESPVVLILHYSGYGYARWGLCRWLLKGLELFLTSRPDCRLLTMYHELWASGSLFCSSSWSFPIQKRLAKSVCRLSDRVRTNRQESCELLAGSGEKLERFTVFPVVSNFGESKELPAWKDRNRDMILFRPPPYGNPSSKTFWDAWQQAVVDLNISSTIVAGTPQPTPDHPSIEKIGFITEADSFELLQRCRYSMIEYYPGYFAKSSILAAYAAHGVGCISVSPGLSEKDGLIDGTHFFVFSDPTESVTDDRLRRCGHSLWRWYQPHSIELTVQSYRHDINHLMSESQQGS